MPDSVPVLLYHHVSPDRELTPEAFDAQLAWLASDGYRTLTLAELEDHLSGRPQERAVLLTFDDGYLDNWVYAYPALKRRRMNAVFFLVTDRTGAAPPGRRPHAGEGGGVPDTRAAERGPGGFLNWAEAAEMADSGRAEFGSHTRTHRGFARDGAWDLKGELAGSRDELERRLGRPCPSLAWPWGDRPPSGREAARRAGYRLAFGTDPGANRPGTDPLALHRVKVRGPGLGALAAKVWLHARGPLAEAYARVRGWT